MNKPILIIGNRNYSSWSMRAWLVMRKSNILFEEVRIPLFVEGFEKDISHYSKAGNVPILKDGEVTVWDSLAIAEHIAEKNPNIWPKECRYRAHSRSIAAEMHSGFFHIRKNLPMNLRAVNRSVEITEKIAKEIARVEWIVTECRQQFSHKDEWLYGTFSIADAMFIPLMTRFVTYNVPVSDVVNDYIQKIQKDDDVCEWIRLAKAESEIIEIAEV